MIDSQILELFDTFILNGFAILTINGMKVRLHLWQDGQTISLTTSVFDGGNYIPPTIRKVVKQSPVVSTEPLYASLFIEEKTFQVFLQGKGAWNQTIEQLDELLTEFLYIVSNCSRWLDQKGREDLIFIPAKR